MAIYRLHAVLIKSPTTFFTELRQKISQFVWKHKRPQVAKAVVIKWSWRFLDFRPGFQSQFYEAYV